MSVDSNFIVQFKTPPSNERLREIRYSLVDAMGAGEFSHDEKNGTDIIKPVEVINGEVNVLSHDFDDISQVTFYQVHPASTRYAIGYERGDFWIHYYIIRYFLAQGDVEALFENTSRSDGLGWEVTLVTAEELLQHFLANGYLPYGHQRTFSTPNNPVHPDCWCNRQMVGISNVEECLIFQCAARGCTMPPVRITDEAAKQLLTSGQLPTAYRLVEAEGHSYWTQEESPGSKWQ